MPSVYQPVLSDTTNLQTLDSCPYSSIDPSPDFPASPVSISNSSDHSPALHTPSQNNMNPAAVSDSLATSASVVLPPTTTKPIPPPPAAARSRKRESFTALRRVVYPPKESCYKYVLPQLPHPQILVFPCFFFNPIFISEIN